MTLEKGKTYRVKLSGGAWTDAVFLHEETYGGGPAMDGPYGRRPAIRKRTRWQFRNIKTGRSIVLKSQQKVKELGGAA